MKNLLACFAAFAAFTAGAQSMPYNPDANDDGYIGSPDLLSFLPLFGSQVGIDSSLTCDYDGTPVEEFLGNVWNGDIIIDSMLVQYHTIDSAEVYIAGCPDPVWETVSYERAWWVDNYSVQPYGMTWTGSWNSFFRRVLIDFDASSGIFQIEIYDDEVAITGLDEILGPKNARPLTSAGSYNWSIPFPLDDAFLDEFGLHFNHWNGFLSGATYVNILPYWHYAE